MYRKQITLNFSSLRLPFQQAGGSLWLRIRIKGDFVKVLQQSNHEERHLIVSKLSDRIGYGRSVYV